MAPLSLLEALANVPDPRSRHGRRHPLLAILVRRGAAPQVLAAVRNAVIHLVAGLGASSHAAAIRRLNARPGEALALLDLPQPQ